MHERERGTVGLDAGRPQLKGRDASAPLWGPSATSAPLLLGPLLLTLFAVWLVTEVLFR